STRNGDADKIVKIDIDYPYKLPCGPSGLDDIFSGFLNAISAQL
ncbi:14202_t:CDS:2, partial [Racocetra persica]